MEFVNYSIEHDSKFGYITVQAKTDKEIPFSYALSEDHTIREIHTKLVEISEDIDKGRYKGD